MNARYELSWTWNSAAAGCHAALEEIGADYDLRFIDLSQPLPDDYLALNPHGKVPVLIDRRPAGPSTPLAIYQSAAILLYLADAQPETGLVPAPGTPERGLCYQWLFFMAEMLQPSMMMYFYPARFTDMESDDATNACARKGLEWTKTIMERLDGFVGTKPFMLGEAYSICDLYLMTMCRWVRTDNDFTPLSRFPNIEALIERVHARPAVQRMAAVHFRDA